MQRPLWSHLFYRLMQTLLLFGGVLFFRIRLRGILREPTEGPVVVVDSHLATCLVAEDRKHTIPLHRNVVVMFKLMFH